MGFRFELQSTLSNNVSLDDLLAEEGLKEFGADVLSKIMIWLRKIRLWMEKFFANKKMEDIKNTPENVLKEAAASVKSPFDGELEEGYMWQPSINHVLLQTLEKKIVENCLKREDPDEVEKMTSEHPNYYKMEQVPVGALDSSYNYVSRLVDGLSKLLDDVVTKLRYVDLGKFPHCREGIGLIQKMLVISIKTLKYYDDIISAASEESQIIKSALNKQEYENLTNSLGDHLKITKTVIEVIYANVINSLGDSQGANRFKSIIEKIVELSNGKYQMINPKIGSDPDSRTMEPLREFPTGDTIHEVVFVGIIRMTDNSVLFRCRVK